MGTVEPCTSFDGACFCQVCLFFFIMSVSWFVQLVSLFVVLSGEYDGGDINFFISPIVQIQTAVCALNKYIPSDNIDSLNRIFGADALTSQYSGNAQVQSHNCMLHYVLLQPIFSLMYFKFK